MDDYICRLAKSGIGDKCTARIGKNSDLFCWHFILAKNLQEACAETNRPSSSTFRGHKVSETQRWHYSKL